MSSAPIKSSAAKTTAAGKAASDGGSTSSLPPLPRNRYIVFGLIAACGCAADLITKHLVFKWLGINAYFLVEDPTAIARWRGEARLPHLAWLWTNRFGFQTSLNEGALFGMGAGWWWLFATFSVVALVGIVIWLFVYKAAVDRWLTVALAFVTGGILGNLYDRLGLWDSAGVLPRYQHGVRDWILFIWPEVKLQIFNPWPNFNIADSLLVTGAIMLALHALIWRDQHAISPAETTKPIAQSSAS